MPPRSVRRAGEPQADLPGSDTELSVPRRRMYQAHPTRGWRTLWSRAHSSRVYHTSYPVPVRRPARLDWASSRRHLARHALALLLAFGSADTWHGDFHPVSSVPCLAHTPGMSRAGYRVGSMPWLGSPYRVRLGCCQRDQRIQLLKHFRHRGRCECAHEAGFACLPIQALDLIR
jgi:hypothetical protein